jgi:tetratricopeptide (TPR) repeat protein
MSWTTALERVPAGQPRRPSNVEAVNYLGLVYRKLDRLTEAESALQQALALEPTRAVAWFQLAQVYGLQNDARRALGALANTYRFAQNPMRAEEILRNIAENEAADTLRNAALETLRLYHLPAEAVIVPPLAGQSRRHRAAERSGPVRLRPQIARRHETPGILAFAGVAHGCWRCSQRFANAPPGQYETIDYYVQQMIALASRQRCDRRTEPFESSWKSCVRPEAG